MLTNDQIDARPPYKGVPVYFKNGKYLIVPALPLAPMEEEDEKWTALPPDPKPEPGLSVEALQEFNRTIAKPAAAKRAEVMRGTIMRAMKRNYPLFGDDDFDDFVTLDNRVELFNAARGLTDDSIHRVTSPGEIQPVNRS